MSLQVVLHDDAGVGVEEAALYYEERRPGLGLEFIAAIDRVVLDIGEKHVGTCGRWQPVGVTYDPVARKRAAGGVPE